MSRCQAGDADIVLAGILGGREEDFAVLHRGGREMLSLKLDSELAQKHWPLSNAAPSRRGKPLGIAELPNLARCT